MFYFFWLVEWGRAISKSRKKSFFSIFKGYDDYELYDN